MIEQGTDAWLELRRSLITATDIPVLLGLGYICEADLADAKRGIGTGQEANIRMRMGTALQSLIGEEYTRQTGRPVVPYAGIAISEALPWAGASPDFMVLDPGEARLLEAKFTTSRTRFAEGLPQDVEAQVQWQLGVTGYPRADVAVLTLDDLTVLEVEADPVLFADLVDIAQDFRKRLEAGGPFARDEERIRKDHPKDDGAEMLADATLDTLALDLGAIRAEIKALESEEEIRKTAILDRMGDFSSLRGTGWHATWKKSKDKTIIDWKPIAEGLLAALPQDRREALVGLHTRTEQGGRPFRLIVDKTDD